MLTALRERTERIGLELKDIDGLDPPKFAFVRDSEEDGCFALVNDDGLPLFSFQEAEAFITEIESVGTFEDWYHDDTANENDPLPDILAWRRREERQYMNRIYAQALDLQQRPDQQNLRDEVRVVVIQELMRHKLIESSVPFDGEIIPPEK